MNTEPEARVFKKRYIGGDDDPITSFNPESDTEGVENRYSGRQFDTHIDTPTEKQQNKYLRIINILLFHIKHIFSMVESMKEYQVDLPKDGESFMSDYKKISQITTSIIKTEDDLYAAMYNSRPNAYKSDVETDPIYNSENISIKYLEKENIVKYELIGGLPHTVKARSNGLSTTTALSAKSMYNRTELNATYVKALGKVNFYPRYNKALLYIVNYYPPKKMIDHDNLDIKLFVDTLVKAPFLPEDSPDVLSIWMDYQPGEEKKTVAYLMDYKMVSKFAMGILRL